MYNLDQEKQVSPEYIQALKCGSNAGDTIDQLRSALRGGGYNHYANPQYDPLLQQKLSVVYYLQDVETAIRWANVPDEVLSHDNKLTFNKDSLVGSTPLRYIGLNGTGIELHKGLADQSYTHVSLFRGLDPNGSSVLQARINNPNNYFAHPLPILFKLYRQLNPQGAVELGCFRLQVRPNIKVPFYHDLASQNVTPKLTQGWEEVKAFVNEAEISAY